MREELHKRQAIWRVAALCVAWGCLYFDVLRRLAGDWIEDPNYSHGFLVPAIAGYAWWIERERLALLPRRPGAWLGLAIMALALILLWAGLLGAELFAGRLSLVISLAALIVYFGGLEWLKALLFPLGILLLAIPPPQILFQRVTFPLQLLASELATGAIRSMGVPALREGNIIELAHLRLQVVEACSGIRSLISLLTLAVAWARFREEVWWRRMALILAVAPIAVVANAGRVAAAGILAHYRGGAAAEGFLHYFSGLALFLVAVGLFLVLSRLLRFPRRKERQS